jgi:hypothetical protein
LTGYCLAAGATLALVVTLADHSFSHAARGLAQQVATKYRRPAEPLWFQGHWGFQYYMQESGGSPMDFNSSPLKPGDIIVVPSNNTNLLPPAATKSTLLETITAKGLGMCATMDQVNGAGFYSSVWGPLPFSFGRRTPEKVSVYELKQPAVAAPENPK